MTKLNHSGFSLLEVLVALAALVFLMMGVNKAVDDSMSTSETITNEDSQYLEVETAMERIQGDFSHIFTPLFYSRKYNAKADPFNYGKEEDKINKPNEKYQGNKNFAFVSYEGHPVPIFKSGEKTEFVFLSNGNRRKQAGQVESSFAWIRYSLVKMEPENESTLNENRNVGELFQLVRQKDVSNVYDSKENWESIRAYPVLRYIKSFKFLFWDPKSKKFVESFNEAQNSKHKMESIKLQFEWVNYNGAEIYFERTFRALWPKFDPEDIAKMYGNQKQIDEDLIDQESDSNSSSDSGDQDSSESENETGTETGTDQGGSN